MPGPCRISCDFPYTPDRSEPDLEVCAFSGLSVSSPFGICASIATGFSLLQNGGRWGGEVGVNRWEAAWGEERAVWRGGALIPCRAP